MNDMTPTRLHNLPPDPIDTALEPFADYIEETSNWLDGSKVETEDQMKAVDALTKNIKAAKKAVEDAEKSAAAPLYDMWKAEKAKFKPTLDDLDMRVKGLVSIVADFKKKIAAEKAEAERKARAEAERLAMEAAKAAKEADQGDINAVREAAERQRMAEEAQKDAARASRANDIKGMRTVTKYEITDHRALLNWIAQNRRDDLTAFIDEWAQKNHKVAQHANGLKVWQEKEAF